MLVSCEQLGARYGSKGNDWACIAQAIGSASKLPTGVGVLPNLDIIN